MGYVSDWDEAAATLRAHADCEPSKDGLCRDPRHDKPPMTDIRFEILYVGPGPHDDIRVMIVKELAHTRQRLIRLRWRKIYTSFDPDYVYVEVWKQEGWTRVMDWSRPPQTKMRDEDIENDTAEIMALIDKMVGQL